MINLLITWSHSVFSPFNSYFSWYLGCSVMDSCSAILFLPALPCQGPTLLWLSTVLHEMEKITSSSYAFLKDESLGNQSTSQVSAKLSLELPCNKRYSPISQAWLKPMQVLSLLQYRTGFDPQLCQKLVSLTSAIWAERWKADICFTRWVCEAFFRKALKCSELLTPIPGRAPDCYSELPLAPGIDHLPRGKPKQSWQDLSGFVWQLLYGGKWIAPCIISQKQRHGLERGKSAQLISLVKLWEKW